MSYPEGEWVVDAWVEGPIYPTYSFQQTMVHAKDVATAEIIAHNQLNKTAGSVIVVSVRRMDLNYPGQTFKP